MIDPFTLATGIVGILGLAIQIAQVTTEYASSVSDAPRSIRALDDELGRLVLVLTDLETFLKDQGSTTRTFEETSVICRTKDACEAMLTQLSRKLKQLTDAKGLKKAVVHLRWPLSEESIKGLTLDVQRYTATFQFSLTIQGCNVLSKAASEVEGIMSNQVEVLRHTQAIAMSIPSLAKEVELSLTLSTRTLDLLGSSAIAQLDQRRLDEVCDGVSSLVLIAEAKQRDDELVTESTRKDNIMRWLNQPDAFADYSEARGKCAPGTGAWLLSDERFEVWEQTPRSLLWLYGTAGCGKSILSSTIISRYLTNGLPESSLAYHFFDFNDSRKASPVGFLCSCISQLCRELQYTDIPEAVRQLPGVGPSPSDLCIGAIFSALEKLLMSLPDVVIVADAVDACSLTQGGHYRLNVILELLHDLHRNVHIVVTSRHKSSVAQCIESLATTKIAVAGPSHEADIERYINQRLEAGRLQKWSKEAKIEISQTLRNSAGNLFRWVTLQLDSLEKCLTLPVLKRSLQKLPQDLFESYDKIIREMDDNYRDLALLALQWLIYADVPMTIDAVAEIMSISKGDTGLGMEYNPDYRLRDTDDVLSVCAGLISIQYQGKGRIVRLGHSTVREYFLIASIPGLPPAPRRKQEALELIAQCCLAQLRYMDGLKQHAEVDHNGSPQSFRLPQSLRWFLSDLRWAFGLRDPKDLLWILTKALYPSENGLVESYIGLKQDLFGLLQHVKSRLHWQDLSKFTERLLELGYKRPDSLPQKQSDSTYYILNRGSEGGWRTIHTGRHGDTRSSEGGYGLFHRGPRPGVKVVGVPNSPLHKYFRGTCL